jgi:hypothetical protein
VSEDYNTPEASKETRMPKGVQSVFKWFIRIALTLFILFLLAFSALQIPSVQNWAAKQVTGFLSKKLQTKVSLSNVSLEFFDKVVLKDFYVEDLDGDTLLYTKKLKANLNSGPISWFQSNLSFEDVTLSGARFNLKKERTDTLNNVQKLFANLNRDIKQEKKPFFLDMESLILSNILFENDDENLGEIQTYSIDKGVINVDNINLPKKKFELKSIRLYNPSIHVDKYYIDSSKLDLSTIVTKVAQPNSAKKDSSGFLLTVGELQLVNGRFRLDNERMVERPPVPDGIFDPAHLDFAEINMLHRGVEFQGGTLSSNMLHTSLVNNAGFKLNDLNAKRFSISSTRMEFMGMSLNTPYSTLEDTFIMKYRGFPDFADFQNKVLMEAHFNNSTVQLNDIILWAPALLENPFFQKNINETVEIDGTITGRINNLRGRDLQIKLARGAYFEGDFSTRNLAVKEEEFINLRVNKLQTTMRTMEELIPKFNPPTNFRKLTNLNFKGSFDGFFNDFVAYGDLRTNLGRAIMDMRLNTTHGRENAEYSGKLSLQNFDLKTWSGNPNLGNVTMSSEVKEGKGLTGKSARAILVAKVDTFSYNNYKYENIVFNGELKSSLLDGSVEVHDDNIDLTFAGEIDFTDSIPIFNFESKVSKLDLKNLNLSKQDLVLSGFIDMNIRDQTLSNMEGRVAVKDFGIIRNREEYFSADSIIATSYFDKVGTKHFDLSSDLMRGEITGVFDIEQIPDALVQYLQRNYPGFMERFGVKPNERVIKPAQFTYNLEILEAGNFTHFIHPKLDSINNLVLKGAFNSFGDEMSLDLSIPTLQIKNWNFYNLAVLADLEQSDGTLDAAISKTMLNKKYEFSPVTILSLVSKDTVEFGLTSQSPMFQTIENLYLNGKFFLADNNDYMISFLTSNVVIWQQQWDIVQDNYIRFGKGVIQTKNFEFKNEERSILVESLGKKGLSFDFENFDLDFIQQIWKYDKLNFSGNFKLNGAIQNVFELKGFTADASGDSIYINGDYFGALDLQASLADFKSIIRSNISLVKGDQQLHAKGFYVLPEAAKSVKENAKNKYEANYTEIDIKLDKYPLSMLEYFVTSGISQTSGFIDSEFKINGIFPKPDINGSATVSEGMVKIDYLQTTYWVVDGDLAINSTMFDATGAKMRDKDGNLADITGGIRHDHLTNFELDLRVQADRFLVLDTKKDDNPTYYGRGIGQGDIRFTGTFQQTNIDINAVTGKGTRLVIPITSEQTASEVKFVRFRDKNPYKKEEDNKPQTVELRGINLVLQMSVTEDAEMLLVFDEKAGDIIRGTGRGDIEIRVTRAGEFSMIGDYYIGSGEYLFTLLNFVNKPFEVQRGGTIRWFGDPFGAEINLVAEYKGLSTPINTLIQEYLELLPADVRREAAKPTPVDLTMLLQGPLLKPNISFDIDFPRLQGPLKNYAQSKLRVLKQDQNELNRQVFGLIVAGQFLNPANNVNGTDVTINTVTELLSNQLSLYFSDLLSELVTDVKFLSGIDLNIGYTSYQNVDLATAGDESFGVSGQELQLYFQPYFFNDRLSVSVGTIFNLDENSPLGTSVNQGSLTSGDFTIEYALTSDRRLKLKAYASQETVIGNGTRTRYGAGISYRNEFDNFQELIDGIKEGLKRAKD